MSNIQYPIRDKKIIELARLLEKKSEISKKELRKTKHTSFCTELEKSIQLLDLEIIIFLKRLDLDIAESKTLLFLSRKKRDNCRKIDILQKNPECKIEIISDQLAYITIENG